MFRKADIARIQKEIQAYDIGEDCIAGDTTCLVVYDINDATTTISFDVSRSLFDAILSAKAVPCQGTVNQRSLHYDHDVIVKEGVYGGEVMVDGVKVYNLAGLHTRFRLKGNTSVPCRILADSIRELMDNPKVSVAVKPVAPPTPVKSWGVLSAEESLYEVACQKADWYYSFSDDASVYRRGKAECEGLKVKAERGGNYALIFKYYSTK